MHASTPVQASRHRVCVFVDFWNCTLSMRNADTDFRADWAKLGPALARAATMVVDSAATGEYQELHFYDSHDPDSPKVRKLHRWATSVVNTFPGVSVSMVPHPRALPATARSPNAPPAVPI